MKGAGRARGRDGVGCRILAMAAWIFLVFPVVAGGHPHAFIDIDAQVIFDRSGSVSALRQIWLFDPMYSSYVSAGLSFSHDARNDAAKLAEVARVIMKNLSRFHYMTHAEGGGNALEFGAPADASVRFQDMRLELTFTLPLSRPVRPRETPLVYSVYDPTYYIEMLHAEHPGAIRLVDAPPDCRFVLEAPRPDPALVERAAALDRTQTSDTGLGAFFAERVSVQCAAGK